MGSQLHSTFEFLSAQGGFRVALRLHRRTAPRQHGTTGLESNALTGAASRSGHCLTLLHGPARRVRVLEGQRSAIVGTHALESHLLTGEYPPAPGGVSDYTRNLARALVGAGASVHVWAPATMHGPFPVDQGVETHPLPGTFSLDALRVVSRGLAASRQPNRIIVQYVPHAFGMRGMNLPFVAWVTARRHDEVWLMLHEVVYPFERGQGVKRRVLAVVTHAMAAALLWRADRVLVSTTAWAKYARRWLPSLEEPTWLPIPSNLPCTVPPEARARARAAVTRSISTLVVGHFGTYGTHIGSLLAETLARVPQQPSRVRFLLLGRSGPAFLRERFSNRTDMTACGELSDEDVAANLAACDVVLQPYADGVSARRTSAMASLALGRPLVTNDGPLTEDVWRRGAVALASSPSPEALAKCLGGLLEEPERRASIGDAGAELYRSQFSMDVTLERLLRTSRGGAR